MRNWLVTGGYGFIGTNFIKKSLEFYDDLVIHDIDCLTYATNHNHKDDEPRHKLYKLVLGLNRPNSQIVMDLISNIIDEDKPSVIIHFAAETHVDRSIIDPYKFVETNLLGAMDILEAIKQSKHKPLLIYVSTDEVYGSLPLETYHRWVESNPYEPNSPYSASKAAAEHFVHAYGSTWKQPYIITNCGNNYGPYQNVEKLIPKIITNALQNEKIPVYGKGNNVRDWIHVYDHVVALHTIIDKGIVGEKYNIGGSSKDIDNLQLIKLILELMGKSSKLINFVEDRPGHDLRYALDTSKLQQLGWLPKIDLDNGLLDTINWYRHNTWFWRK